MRRILIPALRRYGGRSGFIRRSASARTGAIAAVVAAGTLALASGASGDAPLITLSVYGSVGANGWYVSDVTLNWSFTAPIASSTGCSNVTLTADTPGTTFTCTATSLDRSTTMTITKTIKLDKTPPTLSKVVVSGGYRSFRLRWFASSDAQAIQVVRASTARGAKPSLVYSGSGKTFRDKRLRIGARYRYTVTAIDQAGNRASKSLALRVPGALFAPLQGERVSRPPLLRWAPSKGARYYNVQLVRGKKILSAWPATNHFRVPRSWVFEGHRYRLHRGVYRWYVWPGHGTFSANTYGGVLGGSSFVFSGR
jgi:hypothetical protein